MTRQTNGDVWRALIDAMNETLPAEQQVDNPFEGSPEQPAKKRQQKPKGQRKDYPGILLFQMNAIGLDGYVRELQFHDSRRWRLDLAHPTLKIAIECHGGIFSNGRHVRGVGFTNDREKMNAAILKGFQVLEFTSQQIKSGEALAVIEECHEKRIIEFADSRGLFAT